MHQWQSGLCSTLMEKFRCLRWNPKDKDLKKKNPSKIYFGNNRGRYGIRTMRDESEELIKEVLKLTEAWGDRFLTFRATAGNKGHK